MESRWHVVASNNWSSHCCYRDCRFSFVASKIKISADFLPQELEWIWVVSLTTTSCFAGLFYADIQLRNASKVVTMIINAMFPSSKAISLGAKEVNQQKEF